jgi:hypothetical protein
MDAGPHVRQRSGIARRRCMALALLPVAAAFAACGGSSKTTSKNAKASTNTSSTQTAPNTTPQGLARDRALGTVGLLRLSDFPSGWVATPRQKKSTPQPRLEAEAASCLHVPLSQLGQHEQQELESPKFASQGGSSVENSVTVRPTAADAANSFAVLANPRTPGCLTQIFGKLLSSELQGGGSKRKLPPGISLGAPYVERLSFAPLGDQTVAYRFVIPINTPTLKLKTYLDIIAVRAGRADTSFTFTGTLKPVSAGAEQQLTTAAVSRLQNVGGVASKTSSA